MDALSENAYRCLGEPTDGAGLYFLLNALRYLGLAEMGCSPGSLARFFQRLARHTGIKEGDPILLWIAHTLEGRELEAVDERLLRTWIRKVRRWCWRNGRIGWREVVRRLGPVTLTPTDLDVTLFLDSVDIRIRRIGLDLDPGWLPWFGRVVRFHYVDRREFGA